MTTSIELFVFSLILKKPCQQDLIQSIDRETREDFPSKRISQINLSLGAVTLRKMLLLDLSCRENCLTREFILGSTTFPFRNASCMCLAC